MAKAQRPHEQVLEHISTTNAGEMVLDDLVHDVKSREASAINNDGLKAQVDYLIGYGLSPEEIITEIDEKAREARDDQYEDDDN